MKKDEIMWYESPVSLALTEWKTQVENFIFCSVQKVGINIDKKELLKALSYDRNQYEKGFHNGRLAERTEGVWIIDEDEGLCKCSYCESEYNEDGQNIPFYWSYCPNCGAIMKRGIE